MQKRTICRFIISVEGGEICGFGNPGAVRCLRGVMKTEVIGRVRNV